VIFSGAPRCRTAMRSRFEKYDRWRRVQGNVKDRFWVQWPGESLDRNDLNCAETRAAAKFHGTNDATERAIGTPVCGRKDWLNGLDEDARRRVRLTGYGDTTIAQAYLGLNEEALPGTTILARAEHWRGSPKRQDAYSPPKWLPVAAVLILFVLARTLLLPADTAGDASRLSHQQKSAAAKIVRAPGQLEAASPRAGEIVFRGPLGPHRLNLRRHARARPRGQHTSLDMEIAHGEDAHHFSATSALRDAGDSSRCCWN